MTNFILFIIVLIIIFILFNKHWSTNENFCSYTSVFDDTDMQLKTPEIDYTDYAINHKMNKLTDCVVTLTNLLQTFDIWYKFDNRGNMFILENDKCKFNEIIPILNNLGYDVKFIDDNHITVGAEYCKHCLKSNCTGKYTKNYICKACSYARNGDYVTIKVVNDKNKDVCLIESSKINKTNYDYKYVIDSAGNDKFVNDYNALVIANYE